MSWVEWLRRWLLKVDHLDRKGHWPEALWYDGDLLCRRCNGGSHRPISVMVPMGVS